MKSTVLNIRVSEELKTDLEDLAYQSEDNVSELVRHILLEYVYDNDELEIEQQITFNNTYEFTCLAVWLFSKQMYPVELNPKEAIITIRILLEKAIMEHSFTESLRSEFKKVLFDVERLLDEENYPNKQFWFCIPGYESSFNYILFINEVWSLNIKYL
tara:strand:- start:2418 stop:2891 length:474 start_codon:yes stop_codon:yes gene_type:complete